MISFDAEGTLVTPDFSHAIWREAIPALYAQKHGIDIDQSKKGIFEEYDKVGDQRLEWYDIKYWFNLLGLGNPESVIQSCLDKACYYPEASEVLSYFRGKYELVVASGTPLELLDYLIRDLKPYFSHIFSSISHYGQVKSADFYLGICQTMNVTPDEVVHIGDSWQFDFLIPQELGIHACHLDREGISTNLKSLTSLTQLEPYLCNEV